MRNPIGAVSDASAEAKSHRCQIQWWVLVPNPNPKRCAFVVVTAACFPTDYSSDPPCDINFGEPPLPFLPPLPWWWIPERSCRYQSQSRRLLPKVAAFLPKTRRCLHSCRCHLFCRTDLRPPPLCHRHRHRRQSNWPPTSLASSAGRRSVGQSISFDRAISFPLLEQTRVEEANPVHTILRRTRFGSDLYHGFRVGSSYTWTGKLFRFEFLFGRVRSLGFGYGIHFGRTSL